MYAEYLSWSVPAGVDCVHDASTNVLPRGPVGGTRTTLITAAAVESVDDSATSSDSASADVGMTSYTSVYSYASGGARRRAPGYYFVPSALYPTSRKFSRI